MPKLIKNKSADNPLCHAAMRMRCRVARYCGPDGRIALRSAEPKRSAEPSAFQGGQLQAWAGVNRPGERCG